MSIAKRLVVIGVVFLCVFTAGTTAFMLVEGWPFMDALYMTTITIFSVGFQEVHPLETRGRILTILLILDKSPSMLEELDGRKTGQPFERAKAAAIELGE